MTCVNIMALWQIEIKPRIMWRNFLVVQYNAKILEKNHATFKIYWWRNNDRHSSALEIRGSSELVLLASQLTKPLKVKRLFPSLVCFLNPSPEAPRGIDLKWENMISILIITNLICWLPVCRKTDWLCYEFLGGK